MNDSNDKDEQQVLIGSKVKERNSRPVVKVLLVFAVSLVLVAGLAYAYKVYDNYQANNDTQEAGVIDPDAVPFDYDDKQQAQRLQKLRSQSADDFGTEQEVADYYTELSTLLFREGECAEQEEVVDDWAARSKISVSMYLEVASCYEKEGGDKGAIRNVIVKAKKQLSNTESEEARRPYEDRIRYYEYYY